MNTEDKFYFGKSGQPERFGYSYRLANILADDLDFAISEIQKDMKQMTQVMQKAVKKNPLDTGWIWDTNAYYNILLDFIDRARGVLKHKDSRVQAKAKKAVAEVRAFIDKWDKMEERARSGKAPFSRPGQPERFAREVIARKGNKRVELSGPNGNGNWVVTVMEENKQVVPGEVNERFVDSKFYSTEAGARRAAAKMLASRPGQPERFDASSLDRKGFAEASSSPMLGKLLSEKQMPEGGWRAVETGGGALVISFEDADVAGNFARRVAGSGYSATAPVQAIGRYWNVEVKNGK